MNWLYDFIDDVMGKPAAPKLPNTRSTPSEELPHEGLTMGTLYLGRQGCGKTTALARHLVDYFRAYQDRAIFVLDWSGSISNEILKLIAQDPNYQQYMKRIVYDEMGHPEHCVTLPELSYKYDSDYPVIHFEDQIDRVVENFEKMNPHLVEQNPTLGGATLKRVLADILRICSATTNEFGYTWQLTEVEQLADNSELLKNLSKATGNKVPAAREFIEKRFLKLQPAEQEKRTYTITSVLTALESHLIRARVGYPRPSWTPREAIAKGQMVLVNGQRFKGKRKKQDYLFTQVYSLIMAEVNKRQPGDPDDKPISLVLEEIYSFLKNSAWAHDIGQLSPQYRNVGLQIYIVSQSLMQFSKELRDQIWNVGNIVCFALENFKDDCKEISAQLFPYEPLDVKQPAKTNIQQDITESEEGQRSQNARQIYKLPFRSCVIKRYLSEKTREHHILWVKETQEVPKGKPFISLQEIKETLLSKNSVPYEHALTTVNQRIGSLIKKNNEENDKRPTL